MGDETELSISVYARIFPKQNDWVLETRVDDSSPWLEIASNDLPEYATWYNDTECLLSNTDYKWTLFDEFGDGLSCFLDDCGLFILAANGEVFAEDDRDWTFEFSVEFLTPDDPTGDIIILNSPSASPSESPTVSPSDSPSVSPAVDTVSPSDSPSISPSDSPTISPSDNPSGGPSYSPCHELVITILTDDFPEDNYWKLTLTDGTVVATRSFTDSDAVYEDTVCLDAELSYRWTLYDSAGDGLGSGEYSVTLNGVEIVKDGEFESSVFAEIGDVECIDEPGRYTLTYRRVRKKNSACNKLRNGIEDDSTGTWGQEVCVEELLDGSGFAYDKCKETCGSLGLGPCAL